MKTLQKETIKKIVWDIIIDVKWSSVSTKYFGKSRSWFSQKMNGYNGNGLDGDFTEEERQILKDGLNDLAKRIKTCADKI